MMQNAQALFWALLEVGRTGKIQCSAKPPVFPLLIFPSVMRNQYPGEPLVGRHSSRGRRNWATVVIIGVNHGDFRWFSDLVGSQVAVE